MTHPGWGTDWATAPPPDSGPAAARPHRGSRQRSQARRRRRIVRRVLLALGVVLAVAIAGAVWIGFDAVRARSALEAAASQVQQLQDEVVAGDREAATTTLTALQGHAAAAFADTHGPHWSAVGVVPWVGPNVRAVQTVSEVIDGLAADALPALMDATALVDPTTLAPVDGRLDLAPLVQAAPQVVAANTAVQAAVRQIDAIDPTTLVAAIAAPLADLHTQIGEVAMTTATASRAVQLLPPMLGADGSRDYLLLVQNNAELRATGGIPGSVILLRATDGAVEVIDQRSGGSMGDLSAPVLPLTDQELALFGPDLGADMRDVTFTPDFPRSAELARAIWAQQVGGEVDGVLSIDPGTLAGVLGATGPVTLPAGQVLTADNAVQTLLNTVYLEIASPAKQDAFFATTAATVFAAVATGQGEPAATVDALAQSARDGRLMAWSAHEVEQALLSGTVLSGELVGVQGDSPVIGVYFNDAIPAKMGYYLRAVVAATTTECRADGSQLIDLTVTLTSTAPADAADLPSYITGLGDHAPVGDIRTNLLVYAPTGGLIDNVWMNIGDQGIFSQTHNGLAVAGKTLTLKPGEEVTIKYTISAESGQRGRPVLRVTPITLETIDVGEGSGCG